MKIELKKIGNTMIFLFLFLPVCTWAGTYRVTTSRQTIDGGTFCDGACDSSDTIIIEGGTRGSLTFQNFNGNGSYITITNEDATPDNKVIIVNDGAVGWSDTALSFNNCKYIDFKGNNDGDLTYGIKVINDGTPTASHTVWFYNDCDHFKISYVEVAFDGNTTNSGSGMDVTSSYGSNSVVFDTFEIHHNWIHDAKDMGMYIGRNTPDTSDDPYIANASIHDNLIEDINAYGMTVKGISSTSSYVNIYNNTIKRVGVNFDSVSGKQGIGVAYQYGSAYASVNNNYIEGSYGPGIKVGDSNHQIYNNIIVNCGIENDSNWGHGIVATWDNGASVKVHDNIIIQPTRYGIYAQGYTTSVYVDRNKIGDAGLGGVASDAHLIKGTGADVNIFHADVADFNFPAWSDDGNYSNDRFSSTSSLGPTPVKDLVIIVNPKN